MGLSSGHPEYDHAIPAEEQWRLSLAVLWDLPLLNKPVMITGASYGTLGSSRAQLQLRQNLDSQNWRLTSCQVQNSLLSHSLQAFDKKGNLIDLDTIKKLEALSSLISFIREVKLKSAQDLLHKETENFG